MKTTLALTALATVLAAPALAAARPMTAEDLVKLHRVGGPSVSPDGRIALIPVSVAKDDLSGRSTHYALHGLASDVTVPALWLSLDDWSPRGARFGGDGMIWFVSSKSGSDQVYRVAWDSTEPMAVTDLAAGAIDDFVLSGDASKMVVLATRDLGCEDLVCANVEAVEAIGNAKAYDEIFVRHWDTWLTPGEKAQLYGFQVVDGQALGTGAPISAALTGNTPYKPFGGSEQVSVSNEGIVYFAQRAGGPEEPTTTNLDIYAAPVDASTAPVNLTEANGAYDAQPVLSPDGRHLAYVAMERPDYESDRLRLMVRDLASGDTREVSPGWDVSIGSIAWAPEGDSLYVTVGEVMERPIYRVDLASGARERLTGEGSAGGVTPLAGGDVLFTMNDLAAPNEVYLLDDGEIEQRTHFNRELLAEFDPVSWEKFSFEGAGGDTVWGFSLKPGNVEEELPIAFVVHGGPQGSFGNSWSTRWNPRALSAGRYAVVSIDFHGSTGYGQDFVDSINQDWGGKPLEDLQLGLSHALEQDAQLAGDRICALGASYGGYMMNWIAGNWSDRFDCLINHNGLLDMRSFYYATEELWFPRWDMGGSYAEAAETYERWNPVNYVENWQTPMLVVLGLKDFRVPYTQGLGAFTALQERGIPSRLLVFPEENHWVLNGENSIRWHHEVHDWMDRWTAPETGQAGE
ncbi:alpha/beta hydrolase family protein [Sphingomicrobium astaxanthinifaciens]|uniref:S9 family peptidase n=1 Tax=Sphingomicrobium astaxanthinifaciens TaxID=1227949 RepID=UPI001FCBA6FE|nr:S9 family peptidase [Sphingomicrobium astaxanthinifaciens]MCJ7420660.1 S9 family peptidase [Sphingomicrobium astaxanthinifaciens]